MRSSILTVLVVVVLHGIVTVAPGGLRPSPAAALAAQFDAEPVFWRQLEIAKQLVRFGDRRVLPQLEHWLGHADRHARGNAALVFAGLGDPRGLEVIAAMLSDRSDRPEGQGIAGAPSDGRYHVADQIRADRYHAAHLLGDLRDARGVAMLVPLLSDDSINIIVPWSLGEIGGGAAVDALIVALDSPSPGVRVSAIETLQKLGRATRCRGCAR